MINDGLRDGKKSLKYIPRPANLTSDRVQNQKDGEFIGKLVMAEIKY